MTVDIVRWGMIGCGDVTEVKSGPGFQKATGSALGGRGVPQCRESARLRQAA